MAAPATLPVSAIRNPHHKPKKKSTADTENPARQQQYITAGVKDRVTNRAPNSPAHYSLLNQGQKFRYREKVPQRDHDRDRTETGEKLEQDDALCFIQERQTICASHLACKSG